jgi:hypothetical protein
MITSTIFLYVQTARGTLLSAHLLYHLFRRLFLRFCTPAALPCVPRTTAFDTHVETTVRTVDLLLAIAFSLDEVNREVMSTLRIEACHEFFRNTEVVFDKGFVPAFVESAQML